MLAGRPVIDALRSYVLDRYAGWALGDPRPAALSFICRFSTAQPATGKVVYYVFRRGARQPFLIAKTVRSAALGDTIRREAQNACAVWQRASAAMPGALPRPLALAEIDGLPVYFETAVPGLALPELARRAWTGRGRQALLRKATSEGFAWLARFTRVMPHEQVLLDEQQIEAWFVALIRRFMPQVAGWPNGLAHLAALERTVQEWVGSPVPLVAAHGDFWGGSLLWGERALRVIDWERFRAAALPATDAFMLAVHPGFYPRARYGGGLLDEFVSTLANPEGNAAVYEHLITYFDQWQIPRHWYLPLLRLFLIECSLERDGQAAEGAPTSWADLLRYSFAACEQAPCSRNARERPSR